MPDVVVDTVARVTDEFVARLEREAAAAIAARGGFTFAVTGGSLAGIFLPALATSTVDWAHTDIFWGDERAVPPGHADSNYGAARELLFARPPARAARLHRMAADAPDLDAAARAYEAELRDVLGDRPQLDMVMLGAGPDGHVCSLFPEHPALEERERWAVAVPDSPKPPPARLTLTLPVLEAARSLVLAVFGRDKAAMVRDVVENPGSPLPAARAVRGNSNAVCLLDYDAAILLTRA